MGGLIYGMMKLFGEEEKPKVTPQRTSYIQEQPKETVVIAFDATPQKCGGFLRLPKTKRLYYYSVDWKTTFNFPQEPDKFEMVNGLIALTAFKDYVETYLEKWEDNVVIKTDNTWHRSSYKGNQELGIVRSKVENLVMKIGGRLDQVALNDEDMKCADRLSRSGRLDGFEDYIKDDISDYVNFITIEEVKDFVPGNYCLN